MQRELNELTVEITQRCTNKCLFCSSLAVSSCGNALQTSLLWSIARQASELGLTSVSISGGEPLLHPDIAEILDAFKICRINSVVYTSGVVNADLTRRAFTEWHLFDVSWTKMVFNVQSTDSRIHDYLAGVSGSFLLTRESMLAARAAGFDIEVHIVPNKVNLDSLESTVRELLNWGVARVSLLRLVPQGYARQNRKELLLAADEVLRLADVMLRIKAFGQHKVRLGIPFSGLLDAREACTAGKRKLIVRYDGKVLPCEAFKDCESEEFILGDVHDDSLISLLRKARDLSLLKKLQESVEHHNDTCPAQKLYASSSMSV